MKNLDLKRLAGKITLLITLFFLSIAYINAQAPSNDNCEGAIQINVDAPYIAGTVVGATGGPGMNCAGDLGAPSGTANDEVWYKFTATKPYLVIAALGGAQFDAVIQVFSGGCGNLALMECANEGKIGKVEKLPINHYVTGETYYFRVYDAGNGTPATPDFQIRVYTPATPGNDECVHAKPVEVKDHCQYTTENQEGATGSPEPNTCANGAAKNDDIWYSFVPKTKRVVILVHASHNYRAVLEVFDKCGGTAMACTTSTKHNKAEKVAFNNLTPGHQYIFRVYNYYTPLSKSETFELCVYDPAIPENDECTGAIALAANDTIHGDVNGSTPSQGVAAPCSGTPDDDLWYKFNANTAKETISLIPTPYFDGVIQVFDGCKGNVIGCVNAGGRNKVETLELTGLTPGKDYFVRVFSAEDVVSITSDFYIVRKADPKPPPPPPSNDECANALTIPVTGNLLQSISGKIDNSTQSMPPCNDSDDANDVWFKFTAMGNHNTISVTPNDNINPVFSVLEGCKVPTTSCVDHSGDGEAEELDTILTDNHTYYLRVYDGNGNNHSGRFTIRIEGEQTVQAVITSQDEKLKVYPIPVQDVLTINFKDMQGRQLTISDIKGNILITDSGMLKEVYDVSKLSPGVYILKVVSEDKVYAIKVIKK